MVATAAKPAGKSTLIVSAAILTLLAAGGGGMVGKLLVAKLKAADEPAATSAGEAGKAIVAEDTVLRELAPVVTNLAEPAETRVRLQVAILYAKKATEKPDVLAVEIADDIVAFMKTLTLSQLQGASGLQALREDLSDRAATRSGGKIRAVMIENLVVQ